MRRAYEERMTTNEQGIAQANEFTWYQAASKMIRGIEAL